MERYTQCMSSNEEYKRRKQTLNQDKSLERGTGRRPVLDRNERSRCNMQRQVVAWITGNKYDRGKRRGEGQVISPTT